MKKYLILFSLFTGAIGMAQDKSEINSTKHEVKSIVVELFSEEWYKNQKDLWKKETETNEKNGEAWYNYYHANRALRNLEKDLLKKNELDKKGSEIAETYYKIDPNSFESNHLMYMSHNFMDTKYLHRAYEIDPTDTRTYDDLLVEAELRRDIETRNKFGKLIHVNHGFSPNIMNIGYNMLVGLDSNAILFTAGDNDTYSAWLNQAVSGFREDVLVLNTSMLLKDAYRKKIFKELNLGKLYQDTPKNPNQEYWNNAQENIVKLILENADKSIYSVNTSHKPLFGGKEKDFYITGLVYKYSTKSIDNLSIIRNNVENKYKLDYLDTYFYHDESQKIVNRFDSHYLLAFVKLFNHYLLSGEKMKAKKLEKLILTIAEKNGLEDEVTLQLKGKC